MDQSQLFLCGQWELYRLQSVFSCQDWQEDMAELVFYFAAGILEKHVVLSQLQMGESQHLPLHIKASGSLSLYPSFGVYFLCLSPFTPPYVAHWMCCLPLLFSAPRLLWVWEWCLVTLFIAHSTEKYEDGNPTRADGFTCLDLFPQTK